MTIIPEGMMETEALDNSLNAETRALARRATEMSEAIQEKMSPAGTLGLPEILEKRRMQYGITDGAFRNQPAYDNILIYQIEHNESEYFEGSKIVRPESLRSGERQETPVGIVVGAGLTALDELNSHGMGLGHRVTFIKLAPWRIRTDMIRGEQLYVLVMKAGDIIGSEDTRQSILHGALAAVAMETEGGFMEHRYKVGGLLLPKPVDVIQKGGY